MEVVMPVRSSTKVAAVLLGLATFDRAAAMEPISIVALGASGIHGKGVALSEAFRVNSAPPRARTREPNPSDRAASLIGHRLIGGPPPPAASRGPAPF